MQTLSETSDAYKNFVNSLDSEYSRIGYLRSFPQFMRFCKVDTYDQLLHIDLKRLEGLIRDYIIHMREDRKLAPASIANYCAAISHFFEMNDVTINWKKLKKFKSRLRRVIEDVPYTRGQIKILVDNATLRDRCVILLMSSAGLRRGALPSLMLKDLTKIDKYGLYKITVYKKEQEQYITYCTPECARVIDQYLQWRARLGENLQPNTILIRREFDTTSHIIIAKPRPLSRDTVSHNISTLLDKTGIRPHTEFHAKSNLMTCHAFRKFFDTQCINHNMNPLYAEYLMGHKTGLIKSYFKPTDQELLEGNDQS
jgi:integrase